MYKAKYLTPFIEDCILSNKFNNNVAKAIKPKLIIIISIIIPKIVKIVSIIYILSKDKQNYLIKKAYC